MFASLLSGISILCCLLSSVWKLLFHIFCSVFNLPKVGGKSSPCYSILARCGSLWLLSLLMPVSGIRQSSGTSQITRSNKCETSQIIHIYIYGYRMLLNTYTNVGLQHLVLLFVFYFFNLCLLDYWRYPNLYEKATD